MTAHATLEEKERCLAAGMNDHVAKPIDPGLLYETLARFHRGTSRAARPESAARANGPVPSRGPRHRGRSRPGRGERAALSEAAPPVRGAAGGCGEGDSRELEGHRELDAERLAHTLKSVSGTLGAKDVQEAAETAERAIRDGAPRQEIDAALQKVEAALGPVVSRLREVLPGTAPALTTSAVDPAETRAAVTELTRLLGDFDSGAVEYLEPQRRPSARVSARRLESLAARPGVRLP